LVDQDQTLRVTPEDNAILPNVASATSYLATEEYAPQLEYSFTSPDKNDPWYATRIVAVGQPASETITLTLNDMAPGGNRGSTKAKLNMDVWGATSIAGPEDDHHVSVKFNNAQVIDGRFDGLQAKAFSVDLDNLREGRNHVQVTLPMDTGFAFDAVNVNKVAVAYPRKFRALDDRLEFSSTFGKFIIPGFKPTGKNSDDRDIVDLVAMREDSNGVALLTNVQSVCRRETCRAVFAGKGQLARYYIASRASLHVPTPQALPLEQDINSGNAKYLIISHPDFIGQEGNHLLETLATKMTAELGSADVVNVEAIYAQYGDHIFNPEAIRDYIKYAVANRGTDYVLLVGGDVYDYRRFENEDATSFIPSLYAATGNNITYAPVDAKYVDIDDDNVPDRAIARLPVRTVAQLETLLNKRDAYLARDYANTALLVADDYDDIQQYDFSSDADEIQADYLADWDVEQAYVDEIGVGAARAKVINQINAGSTLTAFFGHSSTNQWSFDGLFTGPDAAALQNQGKPTVVTQWGCWNAYYVSPNEDSMGHRFMMEGDRGAVAVMGASTLTNANSERELARLVFQRLSNGERLGDAVTNAKQEYAQTNPNDLDVLLGWTVLGLPELFIN